MSDKQTCMEWLKENKPISGMPYSVNPLITITIFLAKRIDEHTEHINNIEERIAKYEDEIDLLWPAWRESEAKIETLEQLCVAQSTEIAKLMKLAGKK